MFGWCLARSKNKTNQILNVPTIKQAHYLTARKLTDVGFSIDLKTYLCYNKIYLNTKELENYDKEN